MAKPRDARPRPLSPDEVGDVLERFGAIDQRNRGENTWWRAKEGGGTHIISVARHHNPLRPGTLGSIIRQSGIPKKEFWRADANKNWPPPIVATKGGLGLTKKELAAALRAELDDVESWLDGSAEPAGADARRLAALEEFRTSITSGTSDKHPVWKWLREPNAALDNDAPVKRLAEIQDFRALARLDGRRGAAPPNLLVKIERR